MKKITYWGIGSLMCLLGTSSLVAQDTTNKETTPNLTVQKYTVMEQFEPDMVLSVDERVRLKEERIATIRRRKGILDTLDMPEKRRQRLLKALIKNPFSDKLNKAVADIEFIEDEVEN